MYSAEAAVELLIGHGCWLVRDDFVARFVETALGLADGTPMVWIDWKAAAAALQAGKLPYSASEAGVLRVAASLAEGVPVALRDVVGGLDRRNMGLVATAVAYAGGYRDVVVTLEGAAGR